MAIWARIRTLVMAFRDFVAPSYHPELHYMRGPGPAFRRRAGTTEGRRRSPRVGRAVTLLG